MPMGMHSDETQEVPQRYLYLEVSLSLSLSLFFLKVSLSLCRFDHSSNHTTKSPDALNVYCMNLGPGGKQAIMRSTKTIQVLYFSRRKNQEVVEQINIDCRQTSIVEQIKKLPGPRGKAQRTETSLDGKVQGKGK